MKKKIVIMGGGSGSSLSIRAMKEFLDDYDISAVIAMSDSGSSSGELRREFGVLPPGDILRGILAMSRYDYETMRRIFYETRYSKHGKLKGFGLGHLFLAFVEKYNGNIIDAIRPLAQALDVVGPVFPVTTKNTDICAELVDGSLVRGEHEIDRPAGHYDKKIARLFLDPVVDMYERAYQEIVDADVIIIGPGSFYASIIATLLPTGVSEAIKKSHAQLIYVAGNAYETEGEIGPCNLKEFIDTLETYVPRPLDYIIYNNHKLSKKELMRYKEKGWAPIVATEEELSDIRIVSGDFEKDEKMGLDHKKLGMILHKIISS